MILTISTTHRPATDLGFLLHKNPDRHQVVELTFGTAHVLYSEASEERCSASLLVDVDPVALVRSRRGPSGNDFSLSQYVNDRPYATSSFTSVALAKVFSTAMGGRSKERPALAEMEIPLEVSMPVVPCRGGEALLRQLFEPLGYTVEARSIPLDPTFPEWGESRYLDVTLKAALKVKDLLEHLYVLLPVLDDDKHYWVGPEEVEKLLHRAGQWLGSHPYREVIAHRYLRHDRKLTRDAMARLLEDDEVDPDEVSDARDSEEEEVERPLNLNEQRVKAVTDVVTRTGAHRVLDLGCGQGKLVKALLKVGAVERVVGVDVSFHTLEVAKRRLHVDTMSPRQADRVEFIQGSLTYRDRRLQGYDAAAVVEVIEHLEPSRLGSFERALFDFARPSMVVVTTPNVEYNAKFESLPAGTLRHRDHRFEWTRAEFGMWCDGVCERNGYQVQVSGIGPDDPECGCPTQMAVFSR